MTDRRSAEQLENELVWQFFDRRREGFYVEVGAFDPKAYSQTWFLEQQGWRGILIEPQSRLCKALRQERPLASVVQVACGAPGQPAEMPLYIAERPAHSSLAKHLVEPELVYPQTEMVKVLTLDAVLEQAGTPHIDFLSIDVEGTALDVLLGFSLQRHRPKLLLIEDHLHHLKVHRHLGRQGYRLVKRTGLNNWYVPKGQPFNLTTPLERLRLLKKVWGNTPFRKLKVSLRRRRAKATK
jgi:FkbM family methyltransferase